MPRSSASFAAALHPDRRMLMTGAGAALAASGLPAFAQAGAGTVKLRLLETTDIHVNVLPYDYYQDRPDETFGLARTASLIDTARAGARNTLLFDNGDFLQGNPMGDMAAYERGLKEGDLHPVIKALNSLRIDAGTLGNHEFNYGLPFLEKALAGAAFPLVSANLIKGSPAASPRGDKTFLKPYIILERDVADEAGATHTVKVGVIGFLPPQIMQWDNSNLAGKVDTRDIAETAAAWIPEMREAGCDIVLCLSHSGISVSAPQGRDENASYHLAKVPGIDAIFTGHSHQEFPGKTYENRPGLDAAKGLINGVPAVMAGFWGSHLGQIDLTLQKDGGKFRVVASQSGLIPIFRREGGKVAPLAQSQAALAAVVKSDHEATLAYIRKPVGRTAKPLDTYFALVADCDALQLISDAQLWYARSLLKGKPAESLPLLSAVAPFKAGGTQGADYYTVLPAGEIALKNAADLYLYPNILKAVKVNGAQLKDWLERSAGQFNQISPGGQEQSLVNPAFPSYNFDVIDGVTYSIDVSQPSRFDGKGVLADANASRIADLNYQGRPVGAADVFVVVTNNYRAGGGGGFAGADGTTIVLDAPDANRDVIIRYLGQSGTVDPKADANWRFRPVAGAVNVVFEGSAKATRLPKGITPAGEGAKGFAKFRIDLGA